MSRKDFFVGYLKTPATLVRFYRWFVPLIIVVGLAFAVWFGINQKSVGEGTWDLSEPVAVSGYLTVDPYPVLHQVGDEKQSVIIVQLGKHSAEEILADYANQWIELEGFVIERGDWRMLEVSPKVVVKPVQATQEELFNSSMGEVSMQGEIIDSKCYLGVMKPGFGKVHRACAAMCLRGGIPPMFVVKNKAGQRFGYLLRQADGSSASLELAEKVAVPVELRGELRRQGSIFYLDYYRDSVAPLSGDALQRFGESIGSDDPDAMAIH